MGGIIRWRRFRHRVTRTVGRIEFRSASTPERGCWEGANKDIAATERKRAKRHEIGEGLTKSVTDGKIKTCIFPSIRAVRVAGHSAEMKTISREAVLEFAPTFEGRAGGMVLTITYSGRLYRRS